MNYNGRYAIKSNQSWTQNVVICGSQNWSPQCSASLSFQLKIIQELKVLLHLLLIGCFLM